MSPAVIQGLALVTFPAASTVFTSPSITACRARNTAACSCLRRSRRSSARCWAPGLTRRLGIKRIYLLGLTANLVSMALLFLSQFFIANTPRRLWHAASGDDESGHRLRSDRSALNTFTAAFFPQKIDSAVLVLNALLGLGTALAPVFVAIFIGLGIWWGLPVLGWRRCSWACCCSALRLPLQARTADGTEVRAGKTALPSRFWIFAAFACSTVFAKR